MLPVTALNIVELSSDTEVRLAGRLLASLGASVTSLIVATEKRKFSENMTLDYQKKIEFKADFSFFEPEIQNSHIIIGSKEAILKCRQALPCAITASHVVVDFSDFNTRPDINRSAKNMSKEQLGAIAGLYEIPFSGGQLDFHSLPIIAFLSGIYGAQAALLGILGAKKNPTQLNVEVAMHDVALSAKVLEALLINGVVKNWQPLRWLNSPFQDLWQTEDKRYVFLHVGISRHLQQFLSLLELNDFGTISKKLHKAISSTTLSDPIAPKSVWEVLRVRRLLKKLFATKPAFYWEQTLSKAGLCCIVVRSFGEWQRHAHAKEANIISFINDSSGGRAVIPSEIIKLQNCKAQHMEPQSEDTVFFTKNTPANNSPLSGIRVLDFTQVIAGPIAGRTLAEFGAEVIRIENPLATEVFFEPFHAVYHAFKQTKKIDLRNQHDKITLWNLVKTWKPQVVIQNFGKGVGNKLGIDEAAFREIIPNIIFIDLTAFGHGGNLENLPGFEQTAQALCGVALDYGGAIPKIQKIPVNDIGCGLLGALGGMAAIINLQSTNTGATVHTSLAASATLLSALHPNRFVSEENNQPLKPSQKVAQRSYLKVVKEYITNKHPLMTSVTLPSGEIIPIMRAPIYGKCLHKHLCDKENYFDNRAVIKNAQGKIATLRWYARELPWIILYFSLRFLQSNKKPQPR